MDSVLKVLDRVTPERGGLDCHCARAACGASSAEGYSPAAVPEDVVCCFSVCNAPSPPTGRCQCSTGWKGELCDQREPLTHTASVQVYIVNSVASVSLHQHCTLHLLSSITSSPPSVLSLHTAPLRSWLHQVLLLFMEEARPLQRGRRVPL